MKVARTAVAAAIFGLLLGATAAYADDPAPNELGCRQMAEQIKAAVQANAQSANLDAAKVERGDGSQACRLGYYKLGLWHYKKALALLTGN